MKTLRFETAFRTYEASEVIGEGGSGRVYGGTDDGGGAIAVKVLDATRATTERVKRFQNEYRFCSAHEHPNIIRVLDHGLHRTAKSNAPFFVMPRFDGSLRSLLGVDRSSGETLRIFSAILDGVEAAHLHGVTHRDLKPENILYRDNGKEIVVADFGIARFTATELYTAVETRPATRLANFMYAAPEQRVPEGKVDARADVYALGLMLNEMFTGIVPHGSEFRRIAEAAPDVAYLDELVDQMLRQDPDKRLATVEEVKKQLIGRRNQFVSLQHLDAAKRKVVPESDTVDPIYDDPPSIDSVDWNNGVLTIEFDKVIPQDWVRALHNMGSYSAAYGAGPSAFRFTKNRARVAADADSVQRVLDHFKAWIPKAHRVYQGEVDRERERRRQAERRRLEEEVAAAEQRARVLRDIRF